MRLKKMLKPILFSCLAVMLAFAALMPPAFANEYDLLKAYESSVQDDLDIHSVFNALGAPDKISTHQYLDLTIQTYTYVDEDGLFSVFQFANDKLVAETYQLSSYTNSNSAYLGFQEYVQKAQSLNSEPIFQGAYDFLPDNTSQAIQSDSTTNVTRLDMQRNLNNGSRSLTYHCYSDDLVIVLSVVREDNEDGKRFSLYETFYAPEFYYYGYF